MSMPKSFIGANGMVITSVPGGASPRDTTACALPSGMKEHILAQPGFPHSIPSPTSPAHCIMLVKGAGLGMYATRPIGAGEVIFAERALVITPQSIIVVPVSPDALGTREDVAKRRAKYRKELMAMLLDRMSPENAAAYRALVNSHMNDGYGPLAEIFDTNSWQISIAEMRKAILGHLGNPLTNISGVCDTLSRINHRHVLAPLHNPEERAGATF
ncbi:hypothetical protein EWM64_g1167 [Hericium alpestre]|uniref:Uncharacterized protein n=1 Tax=Hericium alpestre TaxID=135208 RepID=A0A4Z0A997_9AGAM|nr:hypothetical protein EWM64_g1167 [Hericium alpestre]